MTQTEAAGPTYRATRNGAAEMPRRASPVLLWALVGAAFLAFEVYVLARWMGSPDFAPRPVDTAPVPAVTRWVMTVTQVVSPVLCTFIVGRFLLWPLVRHRRLTFDGMLVVAYFMLWFQDPTGNLIGTQLYYSSHWVNMGSWTAGSFPGWVNQIGRAHV